ncbi:MAG: hypothetical protein JWQ71_3071 [Pedosphaera sp.]|nr:hypothetical protein [Pedosphaera sp.]
MNFLKRLFSKKAQLPEQPAEFTQEDAPDWLIELKGESLPDGNTSDVRLSLFDSNQTGSAQIIIRSGGELKQSNQVDLAKLEFDRLKVILGFFFPDDIADASVGASNQLVTISIYRREPYAVAVGKCDLTDWLNSKKSGPPIIEIGKLLIGVQRRAVPIS